VRLPDNAERRRSSAMADGESTQLGKGFHQDLAKHPGRSGVFLLGNGLDACVAHALLARRAERSIDLQYYMFHQDTVGRLLINELLAAADRGVRVLTNSLASNDVAAVHAGYAKYRKQLLRCGVEPYELNEQIKRRQRKLFRWLPGLSKSSLHAKTMSFDKKCMFVGSFNFDQRSLYINIDPFLLRNSRNNS